MRAHHNARRAQEEQLQGRYGGGRWRRMLALDRRREQDPRGGDGDGDWVVDAFGARAHFRRLVARLVQMDDAIFREVVMCL